MVKEDNAGFRLPLYKLLLLANFAYNPVDYYINLRYECMALNKNNMSLALPEAHFDENSLQEYDLLISTIINMRVGNEPVFKVESALIPETVKKLRDKEEKNKILNNIMNKRRDCIVRLSISRRKVKKYLKEYILENETKYKTEFLKFTRKINTDYALRHYKFKYPEDICYLLLGYAKGLVRMRRVRIEFPEWEPDYSISITDEKGCLVENFFQDTLFEADVRKLVNNRVLKNEYCCML